MYKTDINEGSPRVLFCEMSSPPVGIGFDSSDNIYVVSSGDNIKKYNSAGDSDHVFNDNNDSYYYMTAPYGMAVSHDGSTIYVADDESDSAIEQFDASGNYVDYYDAEDFPGDGPMQVAVDDSDNVYISNHDTVNNKNIIYKMKTRSDIEVYASYDYECDINEMTVDNNGNIYVIEGNFVKKITVSPELQIDTANPPNATAGTAYSYTFTSTGGLGTKTYEVTGGSLPAGLTLSEDGVLSGIPTVPGTSQFTITATDSETASRSSTTINLTVNPAAPTSVLLAPNSLGIAGNAKITGLTAGNKYKITADGVTKYVKADGTLSNSESEAGNIIGTEITGLINGTTYNAEVYTLPATGKISSKTDPSVHLPQFLATFADGQFQHAMPPLPIDITIERDGTKRGRLELDEVSTKKMIDSLTKQRKDTAIIMLLDPQDELLSLTASIPPGALTRLLRAGINLEIKTPNGGVRIPKEVFEDFKKRRGEPLQFKFVPTKDKRVQDEIGRRALSELERQALIRPGMERRLNLEKGGPGQRPLRGDTLILGRSLDISSNIRPGQRIGIDLPIKYKHPNLPGLERKISNDLGVYIEHSNGKKVLQKFDNIRFESGSLIGRVTVDHLSNFTIMRLNEQDTETGTWENDEQGWKYIVNEKPASGWNQIEGDWYLMNSEGIMQRGWQKADGTWYFIKDTGVMATGWMQSNGIWYLLNNNGAMATDWQKVNDKWYYLYSDGTMASNTVIDGYKLDQNGAWMD